MKILFTCLILILLILPGCQKQNVQVTISYDKIPMDVFPYSSYGEIAKIYYTVGSQSFEKTVQNHRSIQVVVPEKTLMRATYEKYVYDPSGSSSTHEDALYTADPKNPNWKF
jgi:hypothetical protein